MKIKIPNLKETLKPIWAHKAGYGYSVIKKGFVKQKIKEQSTIPEDKEILKKLGIKKHDKVLAIAGYYASWASKLAKAGAEVDYSDISKSMVKYVKKIFPKLFKKYICSNYELIPEKSNQYDWTFTFEACGANQGLPLAYLRSLLNNKGGILVLYFEEGGHMGGKFKRYPRIIRMLAKIYKAAYSFKKIRFKSHKKGRRFSNLFHMVYILKTNYKAKKKAEIDLEILEKISNKEKINLKEEAEKLKISKKQLLDSITRLSRLSKIMNKEFIKELKIE